MYHFFLLFHCVNILAGPASQERTRIFPTRQEGSFSRITCVALTDDFLYYGTEAGTVEVFFIGEFVLLAGTVLPCSALFCPVLLSFLCLSFFGFSCLDCRSSYKSKVLLLNYVSFHSTPLYSTTLF